jgi:helix-turn-helix protein
MAALIVRTSDMPKSKPVVERRAYVVNDACRALSISRATAYELMRSGALPFFLIGGRRHISVDVIEALARGEHPGQAQPKPAPRRRRAAA